MAVPRVHGIVAVPPDVEGRDALRRSGLSLVWLGEAWNAVEAMGGLVAAVASGSVALFAFGLDSFVELFAGLVLIWRLRVERGPGQEARSERRAARLVGLSLFILAGYIAAQAGATLLGYLPEPQVSVPGAALATASAAVMTVLYVRKSDVARRLGSRALRAEAVQSLICDVQDLTVVAGLALSAWFGWWWADPFAALLLIPFILREGRSSLRSDGS